MRKRRVPKAIPFNGLTTGSSMSPRWARPFRTRRTVASASSQPIAAAMPHIFRPLALMRILMCRLELRRGWSAYFSAAIAERSAAQHLANVTGCSQAFMRDFEKPRPIALPPDLREKEFRDDDSFPFSCRRLRRPRHADHERGLPHGLRHVGCEWRRRGGALAAVRNRRRAARSGR